MRISHPSRSSFRDGIKDTDKGYRAAIINLEGLDGMQLRIGVQSKAAKYPRKKGSTPVALVGNAHGVHRILGSTYDIMRARTMGLVEEAIAKVRAGAKPEAVLVGPGIPLRDAVRAEIKRVGLVDTYRLMASIGAALYLRKKWIAGDPRSGPDRSMIRAEKKLAKAKGKIGKRAGKLGQRIANKRAKASRRRKA